jgi:hypothetical protein
MKINYPSDEIKIDSFKINCKTVDVEVVAEINEVDMGGWTLLECFVFDTIIYFGWDEDLVELELIDMEELIPMSIIEPLEDALIKCLRTREKNLSSAVV